MTKAKQIFDQLAALQSSISEDDFVDAILAAFGSTYRPFTPTIEAYNALISFDDLFDLLLSEEFQLKADELTISDDVPITLFVRL